MSTSGSAYPILTTAALIKSDWVAVARSMWCFSTPQAAAAAIAAVVSLIMRKRVARSVSLSSAGAADAAPLKPRRAIAARVPRMCHLLTSGGMVQAGHYEVLDDARNVVGHIMLSDAAPPEKCRGFGVSPSVIRQPRAQCRRPHASETERRNGG